MVKKVVLSLIIACLFTLLPFKVAMANEPSMEAKATVLTVSIVAHSLPTTLSPSTEAEAKDSDGSPISITTGGTLSIHISEGEASITLPIALSEGQTLASFTDTEFRVEFSENKLTISLKDSDGNEVIRILGEIEEVKGEANSTKIVVKNVVLKLAEFSADFSPVDKEVGEVSAYFEVDLCSLPEDAFIEATIKEPRRDVYKAFELTASSIDATVADIAYILKVEKTSLENTNLGEAIITMKVGRAWVEKYGLDNINILRYNEEGECQILPTTFIGYEGGQAIFQATSPDGLSTFGLVALVPLLKVPINWIPIIGGAVGGVIVIGLLVYFFIIRRRRMRDETLKRRWPTGLRPEDWETKSR
jgi:PGF-pre-PGF domain-containing protein